MIFLTVGTLRPFDRLVQAIDSARGEALIQDDVFAQIGYTSFRPRNMEYVEVLDEDSFNEKVAQATFLISHAGIGSIFTAMSHNKPLLVMPRRRHLKEHVNDHQLATAEKFERLGYILVAYEAQQLPMKIKQLNSFAPRRATNQAGAVIERIARFLRERCTLKE